MSSILRFLVVVLVATITLINFLAALHGYRSSMAEAELLFDEQLADIAGVMTTMVAGSQQGAATALDNSSIAYQVWRNGVLESSSGNIPAEPITPFEPGYLDVNFAGFRWRTYTRYLQESDHWLIVAERADMRFDVAESVIVESVLPIVLGLPLACLLTWIIVRRGLQPLSDLAQEMRVKRSDDLSPVTDTSPPRELAVLIASFNDLLARLDASFERERRFAADAAHELRTPVSVLKVELHNLLDEAELYRPQLEHLAESVERMKHSVEQVLMFYRTTPEQFRGNFRELDLASIAREVVADLYPQLESRGQAIKVMADSAPMSGDSFTLQTLVSNLVENASKFSGEGGRIKVAVRPSADRVQLVVEDNGPGIPPEQHDRVFERFYRGEDGHQDSAAGGSGIGLAIVQHVADIHHAKIALEDSSFGTGLGVYIDFPAAFTPGREEQEC